MQYGPMKKTELAQLAELLGNSFAFPAEEATPWLRGAGLEHVRVVRDGRIVLACLLLVPMGQYFGGRSVPMFGVAGVGVSISARGRGVGRFVMTQAMRELGARGVALSTLYPSTQTLYRSV